VLAALHVPDHRGPDGVELARRCRRPLAGDAVGLLDEGDTDVVCVGDLGRPQQVESAHVPRGAVAEHERGYGLAGGPAKVHAGGAVRGVDVDRRHRVTAVRSSTPWTWGSSTKCLAPAAK
jgi:hypothetical protein